MLKKRLSIKIVGHDYVTAWKNEDKKSDKEPDFKGDGVAVWVYEYEAKESTIVEELV